MSIPIPPGRRHSGWRSITALRAWKPLAPVGFFDSDRGLESRVEKVQRHRGVLYAATIVGVFFLDATSGTFKPVNMPVAQAWDFLAIEGQLLAATSDGVYAVNGGQATFMRQSVNNDFYALVFHRSRQDGQRVFVGLFNGLTSLRWENGIWRDEGHAPGIQDEIRTLVETKDGRLWAGTYATGLLRLTFPRDGGEIWQDVQVERFGPEHGLPDGRVYVHEINGTPYFTTLDNIYRFDPATQRFAADSTFMVVPSDGGWILKEDERGRVWVLGKGMALSTRQADGSYQWLKAPFRRFSDVIISTVYSEENGVVWFGTISGLIRYGSNREMNYAVDYPALVRRVVVGEDSVILGGLNFPKVQNFRKVLHCTTPTTTCASPIPPPALKMPAACNFKPGSKASTNPARRDRTGMTTPKRNILTCRKETTSFACERRISTSM